MHQAKPSKVVPVLAGGLFLGVLSGIPVLGAINCACCALVIAGGILSSYLYMKDYPPEQPKVEYGDGALLGLLAGLVGAVVATLVAIPFQFLMGSRLDASSLEKLRNTPDVPPEVLQLLEMIEPLLQGGASLVMVVIGLLINSFLFSIFGMVGGIIGVALFGPKGGASAAPAPAPYAPAEPIQPAAPPQPAPAPPQPEPAPAPPRPEPQPEPPRPGGESDTGGRDED